jgi:hypothetical protein
MRGVRALLRYSFLVVAAAASTSCDLLNPCYDEIENGPYAGLFMDGTWALVRVNGAVIPALGYKVNSTDYLRAGSMDFKTRKVVGACTSPEQSDGIVLARYAIGTAGGQVKPGESASGDFTFVRTSGKITLKAYGISLSSTVTNSNTFTMAGYNPDRFENVTLTFTR